MAENVEVTRSHNTSPSSSAVQPSNGHGHLHEAAFVRPADLLRPRAISRPLTPARPDRPIDRDERAGLKAIRDFLRVRTCYEVLPLSFRLIELDVGLTVKESLNILVQCGMSTIYLATDCSPSNTDRPSRHRLCPLVGFNHLHLRWSPDCHRLPKCGQILQSSCRQTQRH